MERAQSIHLPNGPVAITLFYSNFLFVCFRKCLLWPEMHKMPLSRMQTPPFCTRTLFTWTNSLGIIYLFLGEIAFYSFTTRSERFFILFPKNRIFLEDSFFCKLANSVCLCLWYVCLTLCLLVSLPFCLSASLSVCLCIVLFVWLLVFLCVGLSDSLSYVVFVCKFAFVSFCQLVCLSVNLSLCQFGYNFPT